MTILIDLMYEVRVTEKFHRARESYQQLLYCKSNTLTFEQTMKNKHKWTAEVL